MREKVQGDLRQDRQELYNKIDSAVKSLNDKIGGIEKTIGGVEKSLNDKIGGVEKTIGGVDKTIGGVEKNLNIKIDATKTDTSLQAAAYALAGATLAVSALGFVFEKKVAVVDIKSAPT